MCILLFAQRELHILVQEMLTNSNKENKRVEKLDRLRKLYVIVTLAPIQQLSRSNE